MKRLLRSVVVWRLFAAALVLLILATASAPWPAFGSSGPSIAVIEFTNDAGAPQSTVDQLSQAMYQAVASSGDFAAAGGGPLHITPGVSGDPMTAALNAGAKARAEEIILGDILKSDATGIVYRLTVYRVDPVAYIRSQVFTMSAGSGAAQVSALGSNLQTLHAARTAVGTIFSVTNGVYADVGESGGFQVGERFNVMRGGNKMAEARIDRIDLTQAKLDITNPAPGYSPVVGDRLIGVESQPAVAPAPRANPNTFSAIGFITAAALTLLAIGHHGQPANPLPQPSPSPSGSPNAFTITSSTVISGAPPNPVSFQFTFSQPVDTAVINFSTTNEVFYTTTNPVTPMSPVTNLGGALPSFDPTGTVLTINANVLQPGEGIVFNFTSSILSQVGDSLQPASPTFQFAEARHPLSATPLKPATGPIPLPKGPVAPGGHGPHGPVKPQ